MATTDSYEEVRRRNVEANKRKLEELRLNHLAHLCHAVTPKSSPSKRVKSKVAKEGEFVVPRRSDRVAGLPPTNYKEVASTFDIIERPKRLFKSKYLLDRVYASDEARMYALSKAEEVQSQLEPWFPSFVKPMLQSHVSGGFWLGLPKHFCSDHLPGGDGSITLVDEVEEESDTVYLAKKTGLSGGWRGFSLSHDLVDGDALVFQLIKPTTFKVHIIRASGYGNC